MNAFEIIGHHIDTWLRQRGPFMYPAYLFRTQKVDTKNIITDESINIYKTIKSILPNHEIITTQTLCCNKDTRVFHEILIIAENLAEDYPKFISEIHTLSQSRKLLHTALVIISAVEDDTKIFDEIVNILVKYVKLGGVIYNGKKIYCSDELISLWYD